MKKATIRKIRIVQQEGSITIKMPYYKRFFRHGLKLLWATTGKTAAESVYYSADATRIFITEKKMSQVSKYHYFSMHNHTIQHLTQIKFTKLTGKNLGKLHKIIINSYNIFGEYYGIACKISLW